MKTATDEKLAALRQAQDTVLVQLSTFLRSPNREVAARLDAAIDDEMVTLEAVAAGRHDYVAKVTR